MKQRGIVCSLTVNEKHLLQSTELLQGLIDNKLIHGLGISPVSYDETTIRFAQKNTNCVLHLICGIADSKTLEYLYDRKLKVLLLGYKQKGRGSIYYSQVIQTAIDSLRDNLPKLLDKFEVLSFDNLALSQLNVSTAVDKEIFDSCFMGEDGEASMYIDAVQGQYAVSSTSTQRYPILDSAREMFQSIKRKST